MSFDRNKYTVDVMQEIKNQISKCKPTNYSQMIMKNI